MTILGIETSCDETAASIVENGTKILSHVLATSVDMHAKTGGVIPEVAAREQVRAIIPVINEALQKGCGWSQPIPTPPPIDAIAVTVGPGLAGSLLVGVETAKTLAYVWKKPIIPVNHLVAHIYANWLETEELKNIKTKKPEFPALALVISGGHTDMVLMKGHGNLEWIGGTRDDAAGEAFDKTARLLGLPYPGGPAIAKLALECQIPNGPSISLPSTRLGTSGASQLQLFPRPIIDEKNFDWSFSGLKTAVLREVEKRPKLTLDNRAWLAAEVQEAIADVLVVKTLRAVKKFKPKSLLLAGGVAANKRLREKFQNSINQLTSHSINFFVPPPYLCTDNASYIAACADFNFKPVPWQKILAQPGLTITGET